MPSDRDSNFMFEDDTVTRFRQTSENYLIKLGFFPLQSSAQLSCNFRSSFRFIIVVVILENHFVKF